MMFFDTLKMILLHSALERLGIITQEKEKQQSVKLDVLSGEITKQLPDTMGRGELCSPAGVRRTPLRIKNCSAVNK